MSGIELEPPVVNAGLCPECGSTVTTSARFVHPTLGLIQGHTASLAASVCSGCDWAQIGPAEPPRAVYDPHHDTIRWVPLVDKQTGKVRWIDV